MRDPRASVTTESVKVMSCRRLASALVLACVVSACGGRSVIDEIVADAGTSRSHSDTANAQEAGDATRGMSAPPDSGSPDAEASCTDTSPCLVTLATSQFLPGSIAVDATNVYWTNLGSGAFGSIVKVSLGGGAAITLALGRLSPATIVVDAASAYWVESQTTLVSVPIGGGAIATLATGSIIGIAEDETNLYWPNGAAVGGAIMALAKEGGTARTVQSQLQFPSGVAVDDSYVYWSENGLDLLRAPKAGGVSVTLASSAHEDFFGIVAGSAALTWTTLTGACVTEPIAGGASTTLSMAETEADGVPMTADDINVYWVERSTSNEGEILAKPIAGGVTTTLATGQPNVTAVAVDGTSVYWTSGGSVLKRTPK